MTGLFERKVALVTGGGSGIGRAAALAFAAERARIAVVDRSEESAARTVSLIEDGGGEAVAINCDVACEDQVASMIARTMAAFGRIDCAFNNAGIGGGVVGPAGRRIHEISRASFDGMLAVNLTGVFLSMKHEIEQMLAQDSGGVIINNASVAGLVGLPTSAHYVAAKHGVVGLTKTAAAEYARDNIRVNCICPGYISTPMTAGRPQVRLDAMMAKVPMGRMGTPAEVADAVVWMCSEKAAFMTGGSHVIDGGYSAV